MKAIKALFLATALSSIMGCAAFTSEDLAKPSEVTLEQALKSVGAGLYKMREAQNDMKTGLIASSVDVTFKLAASAKESGKLTIDLSKSATTDPTTKSQAIGGEKSGESSAARSNEISVKFVNILTIPKDTLAHTKSPEDLRKIVLLPSAGGWTTFGTGISEELLLQSINPQK